MKGQSGIKSVPVIGYEDQYSVDELGRVSSKYGRKNQVGEFLMPNLLRNGYCQVSLFKNGMVSYKKVHRLVAEAFIQNPENKPQVNHKNGIKTDNRVENLEWVTAQENVSHSFRNRLRTNPKGSDHYNTKLNESDISDIKKLRSLGASLVEIGNVYGVSHSTISRILNKKTWAHV